jgi:hypothetical protein
MAASQGSGVRGGMGRNSHQKSRSEECPARSSGPCQHCQVPHFGKPGSLPHHQSHTKQTQYNSLAAVCDLLRKLYPASESSFAVFVSIVIIAISCHQRLFSQRQNLLPWPLCIRFRDRRSWFVCVVFQLAEKRISPRKVFPCQLSDGLMLQCPDI